MMRIAVSGTHCCGKSTLIDAFLRAHPDYSHEPEPYTVMVEDYGEAFAAEPSADDFYRQLEFNVDRLRRYKPGERVIYERSPVDFLAYLLALNDLNKDDEAKRLAGKSLGMVIDAIRFLDLIVFVPLDNEDGEDEIAMPDSEDPQLRRAVDDRLTGIFNDDDFNLFTFNQPTILEARGSTAGRLVIVEAAISD